RAEVADQRLHHIALRVVERVRGGDRLALLSQRSVQPADHLRLAEEGNQALLERARQTQVVSDLEELVPRQIAHWCMEWRCTSWAASMSASERVGWAWMVLAIDSLVASSSSAAHASTISSVALGPTMCTPRSSSYFDSVTNFTSPPDSPRMRAFEFAVNGNLPILTS